MPPFPDETRVTGRDGPTAAVLELVADAENVDPAELDPLHEAVDPDALNALFAAVPTAGKVVFRYHGYDVTVESGGRVRLDADDASS